jgi:hypothetical protein
LPHKHRGFGDLPANWPTCGKNGTVSQEPPFIDLDVSAVWLMSFWMSEDPRMDIFDAVGLAAAFWPNKQ